MSHRDDHDDHVVAASAATNDAHSAVNSCGGDAASARRAQAAIYGCAQAVATLRLRAAAWVRRGGGDTDGEAAGFGSFSRPRSAANGTSVMRID